MPTPRTEPAEQCSEVSLRAAALNQLRQGRNPFASQVATVGTAEESILVGVPEFTENQLSELLAIIAQYRTGRPATRVYPVVGDRGAGKTHLLYSLRNKLRQQAVESGDETLIVVVERLSPGMDAVDYLLWQIVNYLLAQKGEGERMLDVIAGRLTARLLAEGLRQLAPHQRADLIPSAGFWSRLGLGGTAKAQAKLDAIDALIQRCDAKSSTPDQIRAACDEAGVRPATALRVIVQHLARTESKDVLGWFRRELYSRLAAIALLNNREPFEELHGGDFEDAPANVKNADNLNIRLLDTWLELLTALNIPVVVVFDQLEDYLRSPNPEQEKVSRQFFTDATARFINQLRNICILIFAEEGFWIGLMNNAEAFTRERLTQPFALPGRPAKATIALPRKVEPEMLARLIRERIRFQFPDLDLTGLPPAFPFEPADLKELRDVDTIRDCLRKLATRYDQIIYKSGSKAPPDVGTKTELPPPNLRQRLDELWREKVASAAKQIGTEMFFSTAFIPEVQNALDGWLQCLAQNGITGSGSWSKVELFTDTRKQQYGYLNVIRTLGPNAPGIGIAAWLGEKKARPQDLRQRLSFFKLNPCPIQTLVLLRADGEAALTGESLAVYEKAEREERDIRIQPYEPRHLHCLMAFTPWHQAATTELQTAEVSDLDADKVFHEFLANLSKELLGWVDTWRQPKPTAAPSTPGTSLWPDQ